MGADKIASGEYSSLAELHLNVIPLEINAVDILRDIPVTGSWYWGNETGAPLPLSPLLSQIHYTRFQQYILDRDDYRKKLPRPRTAFWHDHSLFFAAKVFELDKSSLKSLSMKIRILMDKGWHGGNRMKSKTAYVMILTPRLIGFTDVLMPPLLCYGLKP